MTDVEHIWMPTNPRPRALAIRTSYRRRPSAGITAVLLALAEPAHGSAVARAAGQAQNNVTALWLPQLEARGFAERVESMPGLGNQGGGRPATVWALTGRGRALVGALRAERGVAA